MNALLIALLILVTVNLLASAYTLYSLQYKKTEKEFWQERAQEWAEDNRVLLNTMGQHLESHQEFTNDIIKQVPDLLKSAQQKDLSISQSLLEIMDNG